MEFFNKRCVTYFSNKIDYKHNLIDFKILSFETFYEVEDEKNYADSFENIYLFDLYFFDEKRKSEKKLKINDIYIEKIKEISENKEIFNKLMNYLSLYYKASIDETLEGSFIKYWILTEKIIKDMLGDMKSDKLLKFRKKIMKKYYSYPLVDRLDELREKRNNYVHELRNEINQSDCNLIRLVSENLIVYIFTEFEKVNKFTDYGILLDLMNQEQKIKDISRLLEKGYL